jgi:hypothetical protein
VAFLFFDMGRTISYNILVEFVFGRKAHEIGNIRYSGNDEKGFSEINGRDNINGLDSFYCL